MMKTGRSAVLLVVMWLISAYQAQARDLAACPPISTELAPWSAELAGPAAVVRSGQAVDLQWRATAGKQDCDAPALLLIALPERVRLSGNGFMALGPGERAPFDAEFARDRLRVVVPLRQAGAHSGTLSVTPYLIGDMDVTWQVLAVSEERAYVVRAGGTLRVGVAAGPPKLVVQDMFSAEAPRQVVRSNSGEFVLTVFDGHYAVTDRATGSLIHAAGGYDPRFSPTSRFVHAFGVDNSDLQVVDLYAEQEVFSVGRDGWASRGNFIEALEWSPGDSFLLVAFEGQGAVEFAPMLVERGSWEAELGCGMCSPWDSGVVEIEIENARVVMGGSHVDSEAASLAHDFVDSGVDPDADVIVRSRANFPVRSGAWFLNGRSRSSYNVISDRSLVTHRPSADRPYAPDAEQALVDRGATALRPSLAINLTSRLAQRIEQLGLSYVGSTAWLPHPVVVEMQEVETEVGENDWIYVAKTGTAAHRRGLLSPDLAAKADEASRVLIEGAGVCSGGAVFGEVAVSEWTLVNGSGFVQFVQQMCRVSTDQFPEGMLGLIWGDGDGVRSVLLTTSFPSMGDDAEAEEEMRLAVSRVAIAAQQPVRIDRLTDRLVALTGSEGTIVVFDIAARQAVSTISEAIGLSGVAEFGLTPRNGDLVQVNADGSFFVHDLGKRETLLSGLFVDDEVVVHGDSLRYEATAEGARFVNVKFPGDRYLYSLDQFEDSLAATGLVADTLARKPTAAAVSLDTPPHVSASGKRKPDGEVELAITAVSTSGLRRLSLYEDGVLRWESDIAGMRRSMKRLWRPLPGSRWLSIQAVDVNGFRSTPHNVQLDTPGGMPLGGRLFVLAVGTDRYEDVRLPSLRFAEADARRLADGLKGRPGSYYRETVVRMLLDSASLQAELPSLLSEISGRMQPSDTLLLHLAGHGTLGADGRLYLADRGTDLDRLASTAISWDRIAASLAAMPGRIVALVDACHAGAAQSAGNDPAVAGLVANNSLPFAVIAASKGRQFSYEAEGFGGGVFTDALLSALVRKPGETDVDGSGTIEIGELYSSLKRHVVIATDGRQTPWIVRSNFVGPAPVY